MRTWIAIAMLVALAACSEKKAKPDISKMEPGEQCKVITKRLYECKDEVKKEVTAALKMSGFPDEELPKVLAGFDQPLPCGAPEEMQQIATCYDDDCKKLAACVVPMVTGAARPAKAPDAPPAAEPMGSSTAPAPAPN